MAYCCINASSAGRQADDTHNALMCAVVIHMTHSLCRIRIKMPDTCWRQLQGEPCFKSSQ